ASDAAPLPALEQRLARGLGVRREAPDETGSDVSRGHGAVEIAEIRDRHAQRAAAAGAREGALTDANTSRGSRAPESTSSARWNTGSPSRPPRAAAASPPTRRASSRRTLRSSQVRSRSIA